MYQANPATTNTAAADNPAVVDALEARTDGNPLFVSELVRLMLSGPIATYGCARLPEQIPEGVQEAIALRAAELSTRCRVVLDNAAILGRDIPLDVLQELVTVDAPELLESLDEAVIAGMLARAPGATSSFYIAQVLLEIIESIQ